MSVKNVAQLELVVGVALFAVGCAIYVWSGQLIWIQIYPPPIEKQLLDVAPFALWLIGGVLTLDAIRKLLS
jgi:hypothetical protein